MKTFLISFNDQIHVKFCACTCVMRTKIFLEIILVLFIFFSCTHTGIMLFFRGPVEPVHCLAQHERELISGTTANRIGVHTDISDEASFSSTKLRSDSFKGVLTTLAVLPLNRLLLLGADTGHITLLC